MIREHARFSWTLILRAIDPEVGILEDPDSGGILPREYTYEWEPWKILTGIIWNVSDDLTGTMERDWQPHPNLAQIWDSDAYENDFVHDTWYERLIRGWN